MQTHSYLSLTEAKNSKTFVNNHEISMIINSPHFSTLALWINSNH